MRETKDRGCRLALLLAATLVSGLAARAFAGMIEGDGKGKAANNCLVELSVQVSPLPAGPKMTCNDCDAGCDLDQTPDGVCTLQVALCVNQTNDSGCTPVELKDRKSTRLNSSHRTISYAVFCLKKKNI